MNKLPRFVEENEYETGFDEYYQREISPHIEEFEQERDSILSSCMLRALIAVVGLTVIMGFFYFLNVPPQHKIGFAFLYIFPVFYWVVRPSAKFHSSVSENIYPKIFKFIGNYFYATDSSRSIEDLRKSTLMPSYEFHFIDHYIKGEHKGVKAEILELELCTRMRDKHGRPIDTKESIAEGRAHAFGSALDFKKRRIDFFGLFIVLSMNKNFKGQTIVETDSGFIGNFLTRKLSSKRKGYKNVKLEDPHFEDKFEVYATDQVEARYLLTVSFMQRLTELADMFGAKIECSFIDNRLYIKLPIKKSIFSPANIWKKVTFVDESRRILKGMNIVFKIIEHLKLHQKTGL